jgi:hypothetical protein
MRRQRTSFAIGIGLLAVTALLHLGAIVGGLPDPATEAEATLFGLLESYEFPGVPPLTLGEVLRGLSLSFSVFLLGLASLGLTLFRSGSTSDVLRSHAVVLAGTTGILAAIGIGHFPLPATLLLGAAFGAFVLSIVFAGRSAGSG